MKEGVMYFQRFKKLGAVFLLLSLNPIFSFAVEKSEVNATYIYLPKIPKVEAKAVTPIMPKKATLDISKASTTLKVPPVITVVPEVESADRTISLKEYQEYQKLKQKIKKN